MEKPRCVVLPTCLPYKNVATRSIRFVEDVLTVEVQGEGFVWLHVVFREVIGFRALDERDLCEFWNEYSTPNGWLYEVSEGGWMDLEKQRRWFSSPEIFGDLREYLLVDDVCVSVLCRATPVLESLGASPRG
ncbi:MAG: hypothetical protein U1F05_15905 [Burkholderiales bacterium]